MCAAAMRRFGIALRWCLPASCGVDDGTRLPVVANVDDQDEQQYVKHRLQQLCVEGSRGRSRSKTVFGISWLVEMS